MIVTETLYEGGAELFVLRLARGLLAAGDEVLVVSLNEQYENKEMVAQFTDVPIKRFSLPFFSLIAFTDKVLRYLGIDFSIKYSLQAKQLKRLAGEYDIVHTHYIQVDYLVTSFRRQFSFKHIVTVHGDYSSQYALSQKGQLQLWLNLDGKLKKLCSNVDHWVVVAEEQRSFLKEKMSIPDSCIEKIYNGFPSPAISMPEIKTAESFTIGMVARGTEQKGWQILIDTFLKLPGDCRLLLVGGGDYLEGLKKKYGIEKRIIFAGFQADPISWMEQMDVFVLPTLYPFESLPTVIIEALFCELPVVATNVGEIERMITDETTGERAGYVIDFDGQHLNEKQLYEKLNYMYSNPAKREEFKIVAKAAFSKFDMKKCVGSYRNLYQQLLS